MRVTPFAALAALVALACASGCGSTRPPVLGDDNTPADGGVGGGVESGVDLGGEHPAACDSTTNARVCGCLELTLLTDAPILYFLLDRSGSMNDGSKWTTVRNEVANVARRLGPRARFGAAVFPDPRGDDCSAGIEVMVPVAGDSPAGTLGPTALRLVTSTSLPAAGGTPTAATLRALTPTILGRAGRTFVILATDGGPNCNPSASCGVDRCIPNIEAAAPQCQPQGPTNCCGAGVAGAASCLDADPTVDAVTQLRAAGVPTFVIGVPGSAPYASLLDRVAIAGGTARVEAPRYYRVDSTDAVALDSALAQVAAKITASCDLPLIDVPDPTKVNVYLDDVVVPQDDVNGWRLDGNAVKLVGATCDRVLAGEALGVRVVAGCPTVTPL